MRKAAAAVALLGIAGCALKGDVRRVERQLQSLEELTARADSVRAVMLGRILDRLEVLQTQQQSLQDSVMVQTLALISLRGDFQSEVRDVKRQLVTIQELNGQSQAVLSQLRTELDDRSRQTPPLTGAAPRSDSTSAQGNADIPGPEELYGLGRTQLGRGSPQTARQAFEMLLNNYPNHPRAPEAWVQIGDILAASFPDSAEAVYEAVAVNHADAPSAPLALYKIGVLYERLGDQRRARVHFNRVVANYPNSDVADAARAKLGNQ